MKKYLFAFLFTYLLITAPVNAQTSGNGVLQKIDSNFLFTEGPFWTNHDKLLFSDINGNKIYQWDKQNGSSVFLDPSGKANGISGDVYGNLYIAQHSRRVSKIDTSGTVSTLAVLYNGDSLNSPNDIVVRSNGSIYFTDPTYGITSGQQELPFCGVFCITQPGDSLILLIDSLAKPNGITFSPDEQRLYVCNSANSKVYYYEVKPDGSLKPGKLFAKLNSEIDGIKTDLDGNVYVAAALKGIKIYSPLGLLIDSIPVPEKTTNLAWGNKFRNTLYITAGTSVYSFHRNPDYPFVLTELLGRPTTNAITLTTMAEEDLDLYVEYGTLTGVYTSQTNITTVQAATHVFIELSGLTPDTKYYYRIRYRKQGTTAYLSRPEKSFHTARNAGSNFVFDVQADPHLDAGSNYITYTNALLNTQSDHPDFMIDLGDNFMSEKQVVVNPEKIESRMLLLRHFYEKICHSIPLYLVIGNHEGELGWLLNGTQNNLAIWATQARKRYYPNPEPNSFYTGDSTHQPYTGMRQSYYAWAWGDALFVVIDPYWFTTTKPSQSLNMWDWTLGDEQYQWFSQTLTNSHAKYKFVFSHQIVGGDPLGQGRGGVEYVPFYEMGGQSPDSSWGFAAYRPLFTKTIHQLMADNCVTIFFHGHDHFYGKQSLDSVIYQEVPQPSLMNYSLTDATLYGYNSGVILPNSGHLRVSVSDTNVKVEYVRSYHVNNPGNGWVNGQVSDSYIVKGCSGLSVQNIQTDNRNYEVYPNPFSNHINVKNASGNKSCELMNAMGQIVWKGKQIEKHDFSDLQAGLYILKVTGNNFTACMKIIHQ